MLLECILTNFILDNDNKLGAFLVGQHDNWSESSSLIIISFIPEDNIHYINADEKSTFNLNEIYFYGTTVDDTSTSFVINKIPNKLEWEPFKSQNSEHDQPPIDPLSIQIVYNYKKNCLESIIQGEYNMQNKWESRCKLCDNE